MFLHETWFPHSLTRAHSYPITHSRGTSLGGSRTQLSLGEEDEQETRERMKEKADEAEWGGMLETPSSAEENKTASLAALNRWLHLDWF